MVERTRGLLPFYLKVYTLLKNAFMILEQKTKIINLEISLFFVGLILLLCILRQCLLKKISSRKNYLLLGSTFIIEFLLIIFYRRSVGFGRTRIFFEALLSCFTIIIMVYLHPYYLMEKDKKE